VAGRVERAVRAAITPGDVLDTPSGRGQFTIARYTTDSVVLLLGEKEAWTPLPWRALEEIPDFLRGRDWVFIGSVYSTDSRQGSLDEHLKDASTSPGRIRLRVTSSEMSSMCWTRPAGSSSISPALPTARRPRATEAGPPQACHQQARYGGGQGVSSPVKRQSSRHDRTLPGQAGADTSACRAKLSSGGAGRGSWNAIRGAGPRSWAILGPGRWETGL
jgi:hypothetical protein